MPQMLPTLNKDPHTHTHPPIGIAKAWASCNPFAEAKLYTVVEFQLCAMVDMEARSLKDVVYSSLWIKDCVLIT